MSTSEGNKNPIPPTDQQRIAGLETRVGELEDQMLLCLEFMRYRAEKEAEQKSPLINTKGTPQA